MKCMLQCKQTNKEIIDFLNENYEENEDEDNGERYSRLTVKAFTRGQHLVRSQPCCAEQPQTHTTKGLKRNS